ncbi:Helitron helicase [Phytophthora megakarya]|uniref:Helitron helicase n=1 Tax=Phytophthora megakarya TaxID=4795 RepID=A0A225X0J4_9STRA|nr:Helitron helicase [Phytophthora megakarya]
MKTLTSQLFVARTRWIITTTYLVFLLSGVERQCAKCGTWNFPGETEQCCCMDGTVKLPPSRDAARKIRLLFSNPVFMKSIRAYNNISAFTSIRAIRSEPLRVDESVTRRGIYNFRVMGTVCHRMGSLLPPPGGNPMFVQIYINGPDSAARVARMTDGLGPEFLSDLDEVMEQYNSYVQQFLHAREILIERSRPSLEEALAEMNNEEKRNQEEIENQDADVHERLIDPEADCELRLHVGHGMNPGTHNITTTSEVAVFIIDANAAQPRDIVLYTRQGGFNRIYETNPHYEPLLPGCPLGLWERFKSDLGEDFQAELGMNAGDRKVEFKTLSSLDNILRVNGKTLNYGLPVLADYREEADANEQDTGDLVNQELNAYPLERLETTAAMVTRMNPNQQDIFDQTISALESPEVGPKLFFVDGPGGTGKSFLLEQLLAKKVGK